MVAVLHQLLLAPTKREGTNGQQQYKERTVKGPTAAHPAPAKEEGEQQQTKCGEQCECYGGPKVDRKGVACGAQPSVEEELGQGRYFV
jgi:hypothetical protein